MQSERFFLKKEDKLKSRKTIDEVFNKGNNFSIYPFKIWHLPVQHETTLQAGFGVSSRQFKKAVDRNKVKRLMREAYRLQKNELQLQLQKEKKQLRLFILYIGKELPDYEICFKKFTAILKRLGKSDASVTDVKTQV